MSLAARHNQNKPESDYILTYEGGTQSVFDPDFPYFNTVYVLGMTYRRQMAMGDLLAALREDAARNGDDIVQLLAETNTLGAAKYTQGNYLLGANWRQYYQSAVRHAQAMQRDPELDAEGYPHKGNFYFNILMLCHCMYRSLGVDDRIRAPK